MASVAWSTGVVTFLSFGVVFVASAAAQSQSSPNGVRSITPQRALINRYCVVCHNAKLKTAGLSLDIVDVDNVAKAPEVWEKVLRKVSARFMPPVGLPRPDEKSYIALAAYLGTGLDRASAANPNPGRTDSFRRLNRTEYKNAIRDLLALDIDVTTLLPADNSSYGFDNITVGELSPTLLERYLAAAQKISHLAVGAPVPYAQGEAVTLPPDLTQETHFDGLPFGTRGGTLVHYTFPRDGDYDVQLKLTRDRNEHVEGLTQSHELEVTLDDKRVAMFPINPPPNGDEHYAYHGDVDKDLHVRLAVSGGPHAVGIAFIKKPTLLIETERQPYQAHFNMDRSPRIQPALYSVNIVGPFNDRGPGDTPSRRRIFLCQPAADSEDEACAKQILGALIKRAYRRPVTDSDLEAPMRFYRRARVSGTFDSGIEAALQSILISPEFLFQIERDPSNIPPKTAYRLSQIELASRLSFLLWSSVPDDELLDAAIQGKLAASGVLEQEVRRMLLDPRSESMVTSFADQWLYLRNLTTAVPDSRLFPDFDDNLRQAMRRETELLFDYIMRGDRSVLELLNANYTFVNERLAKYYGIPHVYGSHFRRVSLDPNGIRGGLLGQGSILTVTSYADRTSPVIRGKWVLTNILGLPPPPPPPSVPPLKDHGAGGAILTMRERMAEHRAKEPCASCHRLMDPVGFSLENYDATGRWRTKEEGVSIDASGGLPDGETFESVFGLKKALLQHPDVFVSTMTEKLLTYALGRGLEYYDGPTVRCVVEDAKKNNYSFSSMVIGITESTPFQMRMTK